MEEVMNPSAEFLKHLTALRRVVLVSHVSPDFDAYSSCAAMRILLEQRGATVSIVNADGMLDRYSEIPGLGEVHSEFPSDLENWDGVIVLDCGEEKRVGDALVAELSRARVLLNVDHHLSNSGFGTASFVNVNAASTTELVYQIVKSFGANLTPDLATAIYMGLSADTGSFKYSSTTGVTLRMAADLVDAGASPARVSDEIFGRNSLASVRIHSLALARVELFADGRGALAYVHAHEMAESGASSDDTEGLVERLRDIDGVVVACFLRENGEYWKGSLRTSLLDVDVSVIAAEFGGGGHRAAAGFRTRKALNQLSPLLVEKLEQALDGPGK